jgi:urea transport system permease protein
VQTQHWMTGSTRCTRIPVTVFAFVAVLLFAASHGLADPKHDDLKKALATLASDDGDKVEAAVAELTKFEGTDLLLPLQALQDGYLYVDDKGELFKKGRDRVAVDVFSQTPVSPAPSGLTEIRMTNVLRRTVMPLLARLQLEAPEASVRRSAVEELLKRGATDAAPLLRSRLLKETDPETKTALELAVAKMDLASPDRKLRLAALVLLKDRADPSTRSDVAPLARDPAKGGDPDPDVRAAASSALGSIDLRQELTRLGGHLIHGLSLASVLLMAALGLAITFGLMGVINMAHGEMLMLGAYTTYAIQVAFQSHFPKYVGLYLIAAVPLAFLVTALVGLILERSILRFLYGRPLESLLATWGISLVLIQTVRLLFGAQNVSVATPDYLSGGLTIAQGLVFPWSRIVVVAFACLVATGVWLILQKTSLGLHVRAISQNRSMAACLGVPTRRVDSWIFALGSGIAGLGGVALSQLGNVGPEMGQGYIIDSFMIVVLGGVGRLMGTLASSLGLGMLNKLIEPFAGAVMGKIAVLCIIILFIQRRPQGMFAPKGRVEA